jgi:glycosyl transferase family 87
VTAVTSSAAPVLGSRGGLWAGWAASRAATLLLLIPEHKVFGDVRYYFVHVDALVHGASIHGELTEYPVPAVAFMLLGRALSGPWVNLYLAVFAAFVLALDAAFSRSLFRAAGWRLLPGVALWLGVLPLLGPMLVCRFDMLPAVLAGFALLTIGRPAVSGVFTGLGAAVKLWPAVLLPSLWLSARGARGRLLGAFTLVVGVAVGVVWLLAGYDRLTSPLHWQGDRGLQVEAYAALPLLVADLFAPDRWHVSYTRFFAFQVDGPGVAGAMTGATVAGVVAVAVLAVLWLRSVRRGAALDPGVPGLLGVLTVMLLIMTDKTFSPQYLIWVAALMAAAGTVHPAALPGWSVPVLLASCGLTHLIFPLDYDPLVAGQPYAVVLLVVRDVGLAVVAVLVGHRIWQLTRSSA